MDRLDWYRSTLATTTELLLEQCGERTAARTHLQTLRDELRSGDHIDRDTKRKLKQWTRRYRPQSPEDRLGHLVRTVVAAAALLQSVERQASSPTTPVLRNVARLACVVGVDEPLASTLAPGRMSYEQAVAATGALTASAA